MNTAEAIKLLANTGKQPSSFLATVKSVDKANRLCDVEPLAGAEVFDVKICSAALASDKGFWCVPSLGSTVIVTMLQDNFAFVSSVTEIDEIFLRTTNTDNGGLILIDKLVEEINNFKQLFRVHTHPTPAGPSGVPTANPANTQRATIENTKVRH